MNIRFPKIVPNLVNGPLIKILNTSFLVLSVINYTEKKIHSKNQVTKT